MTDKSTPVIALTSAQKNEIDGILSQYLPNTEIWVYGSRIKGTSRPQSDLDLVVFATPDQQLLVSDLRDAFEESNLPFRVDLFIWDEIPEAFQKTIQAEHVLWDTPRA